MKISSGLPFLVVYCIQRLCQTQPCSPGYLYHKQHHCVDINECTWPQCDPSAICRNTIGSYECYCGKGFIRNPGTSSIATTCKDVDECENEDVCGKNAICYNSLGSYRCICPAGFQPVSEQTQGTCTVQPLNCPNPEKPNNSTLEQPNCVGDESRLVMESARHLLDKVCQNFSITDDIQAIANFTNGLLSRNSRLQNMTTTQRLNVAATILDLLENMAMAVALTLSRGETKSISEDSFAGKIQVFGNQNMPGDLARIEIQNNTMEINWRTVMGAKNSDDLTLTQSPNHFAPPDFAAVSFFVFSDMESILNSEIHKDGIKQLEATEGTGWLNSKVVTARISNKAASHNLTEMVNFTLKLNQVCKGDFQACHATGTAMVQDERLDSIESSFTYV
ncbi:adhesion G protein-coupled receptor E2-like [Hemiscyllium ocellatum]|uniref:adhesion G protein-coupled receptor E2-like n=1 Tax=Hemiscyllium ocellatum TaxID=170820 RepID=UPI00296762F2|nr:adhesion G protein-coupled receptor E2-like [Hemiscyllium ocellatum]